jgi:hypothetical protein
MSWPFWFASVPGLPPADGEVRLDAFAPWVGLVTRVFFHTIAKDGARPASAFLAFPVGSLIFLQPQGSRQALIALRITAPGAARAGYVELPVTCTEATAMPSGMVDVFFLRAGAGLAVTGPGDPDLVTLDVAKAHLRITDTAHDADVAQKVSSASASIRDYLDERNDPTWTPDTVPPWLQAAVLLLLGHLYEHRGDEFGPDSDNDDRVWTAIERLTRRSRDSTVA